jgi:hypothetical protein
VGFHLRVPLPESWTRSAFVGHMRSTGAGVVASALRDRRNSSRSCARLGGPAVGARLDRIADTCVHVPRKGRFRGRSMSRPPLPPFTAETAAQKARMAEDAWNTRDPAKVAPAYTIDSRWRNRAEFLQGRAAIERS